MFLHRCFFIDVSSIKTKRQYSIGDLVAIFGLGAIGLMAVQIARAGGARHVFAVDPMPNRRDFAEAHGADKAFDPSACDASLEIKRHTGNKGMDVSIETSGNSRALHEAIAVFASAAQSCMLRGDQKMARIFIRTKNFI